MIHFLLLAISLLFWREAALHGDVVREARWEHRLLAYVVTSEEERTAVEGALAAAKEEMADRDLLLVNLGEIELRGFDALVLDSAEKGAWRELWELDMETSRFVLVGKDGGAKAFQKGGLDVALFFDLIDTMPMRRAEMRSRE